MFQLFEFALPAMSMLPVEMLAMILRYLSPETLLNAVLTSKHFMKVCRGDPILRERIRLQIRKEKELQLQGILDTRKGIVVICDGQPRIINPNVKKFIVNEEVQPNNRRTYSTSKAPEARSFRIVPEAERVKGGGKVRQRRRERVGPYKTVRC